MAEPFIGEIKMVGFNYAPQGWAFCDGSLLSIQQNTALFSLIGTYYGGDGRSTFGLPDLRGRVPIHQGQGPGLSQYVLGELGGTESVALTPGQMPAHNHLIEAAAEAGNTRSAGGAVLAKEAAGQTAVYNSTAAASTPLRTDSVTLAGNNIAHPNVQPFQCVNFIIALVGIYPPRS